MKKIIICLTAMLLLVGCTPGAIITPAPSAQTEAPTVEITEAPTPEITAAPTFDASQLPFLEEAESVEYAFDTKEIVTPFWLGNVIYNEIAKPVENGDTIEAVLLYTPVKIISVYDAWLKRQFVEGEDYTVEGNKIKLLEGSKCRSITAEKARGAYVDMVWDAAENANLHVTYVYQPQGDLSVTDYKGALLPKTEKLIADKDREFNLCVLGDSICYGWAASGGESINRGPKLMPLADQIKAGLELYRGGTVNLNNASVGGWSTKDALDNITKVYTNFTPDLVVISYGINDAGQNISRAKFTENMNTIMNTIREHAPECEFLLLAPIYPNPVSAPKSLKSYDYREDYAALEKEGQAVVDLYTLWDEMLKTKRYCDLTGDNSCHPNDFGQRMYAMSVLAAIYDFKK